MDANISRRSDTGGSQTGSVVTNDEIIAFALPKK